MRFWSVSWQGRLRSPVSLPARMRSSTRASRRYRSSRSASWRPGPPRVVLVRNPVMRMPLESVVRSCAPGCGRSLCRISLVPGGQPVSGVSPVASATHAPSRGSICTPVSASRGLRGLIRRGSTPARAAPRGRCARRGARSWRRRRTPPPASRGRCSSRPYRGAAARGPAPRGCEWRGRRTRAADGTRRSSHVRVASCSSECAVTSVASRSMSTCRFWTGAPAMLHTRSRARRIDRRDGVVGVGSQAGDQPQHRRIRGPNTAGCARSTAISAAESPAARDRYREVGHDLARIVCGRRRPPLPQ